MGYGTILDYAVAQGPALVFVERSPDVLLDTDSEFFLAASSCDAHIALAGHIVGDDIDYMASIGSLFSHHTYIIAPFTIRSSTIFFNEIKQLAACFGLFSGVR